MVKRTLPGLGLTAFWPQGDDTWKDEMDANIRALSALVNGSVKSRVTALPGSPSVGDIYIVPSGAGSNPNQLAVWDGDSGSEAWVYLVPNAGWAFYVEDESKNYQWSGAAWAEFAGAGGGGGGGAQTLVYGPAAWRGARLGKDTTQAISKDTSTNLIWEVEEEDEGGWFDSGSNTRLTVPAGVTRIRLAACVDFDSAANQAVVQITKNGSLTGMPGNEAETGGGEVVSVASGVMEVTPGDYFQVEVYVSATGGRDVEVTQTFFSIEAVEFSSSGDGMPYDIRTAFSTAPTSSQVIDTILLPREITFPADFADSVGSVATNPTASFEIAVKDDGATFGTVTVGTDGLFAFSTTGAVEQTVAAGSVLTFEAPASVDATIANLALTIAGFA